MEKYLLPRLQSVIYFSIFCAVLIIGPRTFNLDGDLGRHITIGNYILDNYSIPTNDFFSFPMNGQPLTPHEWLAQVIFALANRGMSLGGPVFVIAFLIGITFSFIYIDSVRRSQMPLLFLLFIVWSAAASSLHWLARPHIFTFLFLALWTHLLEQIEQGKKIPVYCFGFLMVIWANTHGGFVIGFVVLFAYTIGDLLESWFQNQKLSDKAKNWVWIGIISFASTLINPVGIRLWGTSVGFIGNSYLVNNTQEYFSPNFHNISTLPFLVLVAYSLLATGICKNRIAIYYGLLLSGFTVMALYSSRNIPLYAIVAAPILTKMTGQWIENSSWQRLEQNILHIEKRLYGWLFPIVGTIAVLILMLTPVMKTYNSYNEMVFPVKAMDWLQENPIEGRGFNYFTWGGYLLFRQWPDQLVFIDGQTDFYGEKLTREYEQVINMSDGWEQVLEKYQIRWIVLPTKSPLLVELSQKMEWSIRYQDMTATLISLDE